MADPQTQALDAARYALLTTFRRDGTPVGTPVWITRFGDGWACITGISSGKVKRLRNRADIEVAPCDMRGRVSPGAPRWAGTCRVVDGDDYRAVRSAILRKYRVLGPAMVAWTWVSGLFGRDGDECALVWTVTGDQITPCG